MRVDADAEVAVGGEDGLEPVAERDQVAVHAIAAARAPRAYSCRLVTSKPPLTASSEATAAESSAIVVNSGMSAGDRRRADLVAVGAGRAAARRVDDHVDLAAVDELDDAMPRRRRACR